MGSAHPPLDYLVSSSQSALESFELARLNAVSNLRKELRQLVDEWVEAEIEARMARWVLERRRVETLDTESPLPALPELAADPKSRADPLLPPHVATPAWRADAQGIPDETHAAAAPWPCPPKGREISQPKHLARNSEFPFDPAELEDRTDGDVIQTDEMRKFETAPKSSAAAAALQSLERVACTGAKDLHHEIGVSRKIQPGEPRTCSDQVPLIRFSLPQGHFRDSAVSPPPKPRNNTPSQKTCNGVRSFGASVHERDSQNRGQKRPATQIELRPAKRNRAPFRPIPLYRDRIAVAS